MGVSTFGNSGTGEFDRFDQAFVTMFQLTTDGGWPEAAPPQSEDGSVNWRGAAFCVSYIIVVNWVVLQVCLPHPRHAVHFTYFAMACLASKASCDPTQPERAFVEYDSKASQIYHLAESRIVDRYFVL